MIHQALVNPGSIVIVGGSNDLQKPGGKVLRNILDGGYQGSLRVINPKETEVQGIPSFSRPEDLPDTDLAIIAIAAQYTLPVVEVLAREKGTRGFIVLSSGYSEENEAGRQLEKQLTDIINSVEGTLIGPNCIGVLNNHYQGVFTLPIPKLDPQGCDFISGSGATACFIMEAGIPKGLTFSSVFSVGNSAQVGVEDILKYMDETFDPETSPKVKLLYLEKIEKPRLLLYHAASLIRKGCRIAAIKAGSSVAGSRAATSHTGAMASSDGTVDALFRKAGIVRCHGREELIAVASVFMHKPLQGKNLAIITHAGGPAVMLTDALSHGGLEIPKITGPESEDLLGHLYPGSSVANPIDFLATGNAQQLGTIIDYVEEKFDEIDAMVVIFGTPGLFRVFDVYQVLHEKMKTCRKPIFPVLPSTFTAAEEVSDFLAKNRINFPDEVTFGNAIVRIHNTPPPSSLARELPEVDHIKIRSLVEDAIDGYMPPVMVQAMLDAAGIPRAKEMVIQRAEQVADAIREIGLPVVKKVVGPIHKSDVGGVRLNIDNTDDALRIFEELMRIPSAEGVLVQPMLNGTELFAGATKEQNFGHLILCGLGGVYIEVFRDVATGLSPLNRTEVISMLKSLKSYKIIHGVRGGEGLNEELFIEVVMRLSALVEAAPEIQELDINPLLCTKNDVRAVDARIRIQKNH